MFPPRLNKVKLDKGARQGDPISAYLFILLHLLLFILLLKNAFIMIKSDQNIQTNKYF